MILAGNHSGNSKLFTETRKLNKKYEKQIKIEKEKTIWGNIVYSSLMTSGEGLRKHRQQVADQCTQIREAALLLRETIMNTEKTPLPESLT